MPKNLQVPILCFFELYRQMNYSLFVAKKLRPDLLSSCGEAASWREEHFDVGGHRPWGPGNEENAKLFVREIHGGITLWHECFGYFGDFPKQGYQGTAAKSPIVLGKMRGTLCINRPESLVYNGAWPAVGAFQAANPKIAKAMRKLVLTIPQSNLQKVALWLTGSRQWVSWLKKNDTLMTLHQEPHVQKKMGQWFKKYSTWTVHKWWSFRWLFGAFLNVFWDFDIAMDFYPFRLCRIYHRPKRFWDCAKGRSENVEKSSRPVGIAGVKHLPFAGYRTKSWCAFIEDLFSIVVSSEVCSIVEGSWTSSFLKHECDILPQTLDPEATLIGATN